ncbi:MAG: ChbG/HpnK family deacetylase [Erysipelotrichaceae bacterium]|nr:ChbG/HpnK family deacetylase [Erysipelotrichaceae bacterium]
MKAELDIHADDFGYSLHTSEDLIECMKEGKLDSISIICNTSHFEKSMDLLYEQIPALPFLPLMSIHLDLPEGESESRILPMSWVSLFASSYSFKRKAVKTELKKELKRQIDKAQCAIDKCIMIAKDKHIECHQKGIRLDSHVHTHLIPIVWESLIEVIDEEGYDIEYIRNPKEPLIPFLKHTSLLSSYGVANLIKNRILMFYSGKVDKFCDEKKIAKMYMWGLTMSGHMDYDRIEKIYPDMMAKAKKDGRKLEILFHPGRALADEYGNEMNREYFADFNSSRNREIEKKAVKEINKLTGGI